MRMALLFTSAIALVYTRGADAQTPSPSAAGPEVSVTNGGAPQAPSPQAPPLQDRSTPSVAEIVVTAQKRSERLVDVPVSVQVVSSEQLQNAGTGSLEDTTKLLPGVIINRSSYTLQPTIRGVGTNALGAAIDNNVAIYVDGVYQADQTGDLFDLANVSSIEVLEGPQGTLFGRNATGGAILVNTLDPSFSAISGKLNASYGSYNDGNVSGYLNLPVTSNFALNGALAYHHSDGWIHDLLTGDDRNRQNSFDARGKLRWKPINRLNIEVSAFSTYVSDPTAADTQSLNGDTLSRLFTGKLPIATTPNNVSLDSPPSVRSRSREISSHIAYDLDFATLSSITAYHVDSSHINLDEDGSYVRLEDLTFSQSSKVFSQELNLTSRSGTPFTYVLGAYFYHQKAGYPFFDVDGGPYFSNSEKTQAFAVYADGTYQLGKLALIAGVRYSDESRRNNAIVDPDFLENAEKTFNSVTPRAGLRYSVDAHSNVYATYSKGFKSGEFNPGAIAPAVSPENINAYELGYKRSTSKLSLNSAVYYYDYSNIQVTAYDINTGLAQLLNAASARIYGLDIDGTAALTDRLSLRAAFAFTHARYTSFPNAPLETPIPPGNTGNIQTIGSVSGNSMIRAPEYTLSTSADYKLPLSNGRVLEFIATPYYSTRVYYSFDNRLSQDPYLTFDASVALAVNDQLRFTLYGRNLTDKRYAANEATSNIGNGVYFSQPLTFGIRGSYAF